MFSWNSDRRTRFRPRETICWTFFTCFGKKPRSCELSIGHRWYQEFSSFELNLICNYVLVNGYFFRECGVQLPAVKCCGHPHSRPLARVDTSVSTLHPVNNVCVCSQGTRCDPRVRVLSRRVFTPALSACLPWRWRPLSSDTIRLRDNVLCARVRHRQQTTSPNCRQGRQLSTRACCLHISPPYLSLLARRNGIFVLKPLHFFFSLSHLHPHLKKVKICIWTHTHSPQIYFSTLLLLMNISLI